MTDALDTGSLEASPGIPDVTVIVVSYNALEWLSRCLDAITDPAANRRSVEVVVIDNASEQPVQDYLAARTDIELVQSDVNLGFGRACNIGAVRAHGRHLLLLNPDAIAEPGCVDALVDFLDADPARGLVGGRTLRPDGALDAGSCWGAPTIWSLFCSAVGLSRVFRRSALFDPESLGRWERDTPREVDIITGCLLLSSRHTWDRLGGFDQDFFMYGEDADLSLRAREAGYRPSITPDAVAIHANGASSPRRVGKQRLLLRGKATLIRKRWAPGKRRLGLGLLIAGIGLRAATERGEDHTWRTLWTERRDWSTGWPPYSSDPRSRN